jgi:glycosyltransferase involved in cell wall biosynthesis
MIIGHYEHDIWIKGGIASYIRRVSEAQQEAGHKVYFLSKYPSQGLNGEEQPIITKTDDNLYRQAGQLGLDVLHLHTSVDVVPPAPLPTLRTLHIHKPYCPSGGKFLKRWSRPCDRSYSIQGCLWGHLVDHCGSIRPGKLYENFHRTETELKTLQQIPVVTVSHFLREQMISTGYDPRLIQVLYLFAPELSNEAPPLIEGIPRFAFLGRVVPQKGLIWLLKAVQRVSVPIHLDIAGEGYQLPALKRLAEKLQITDRITFHGWVNEHRINELIKSSRALVFPSVWHEPGGTVAFEAMANSRAIIMSKVGGMPEVVLDGQNGLLVEPNDVQQLAAGIERLASNWQLATQLGLNGRKMSAGQYSLSNHVNQLIKIYHQIIEEKNRAVMPV